MSSSQLLGKVVDVPVVGDLFFWLFFLPPPPVDDSLCCLPSCQHCVSVLCVLRLRSRRSALFRIQSLSPRCCFFLFFFVSSFVVIVSVTSVRPCDSTPTPNVEGVDSALGSVLAHTLPLVVNARFAKKTFFRFRLDLY